MKRMKKEGEKNGEAPTSWQHHTLLLKGGRREEEGERRKEKEGRFWEVSQPNKNIIRR